MSSGVLSNMLPEIGDSRAGERSRMPLITFSEKFSVKVREIDLQHKKLIDLINTLFDAMKVGKGNAVLQTVIKELVVYTGYHFSTEEKYMKQFSYPALEKHREEHKSFVQKVTDLQKEFDGRKVSLSLEVMNFLKEWLTHHILEVDMAYSSFFNEKGLK